MSYETVEKNCRLIERHTVFPKLSYCRGCRRYKEGVVLL